MVKFKATFLQDSNNDHLVVYNDIDVEQSYFYNFAVIGEGGAILLDYDFIFKSIHCVYTNCSSSLRGGAIKSTNAILYFNYSICTDCKSNYGATITSCDTNNISIIYYSSFCANFGKGHPLYFAGNKQISVKNINNTNDFSNRNNYHGSAICLAEMGAGTNYECLNCIFNNCSKSFGLIQIHKRSDPEPVINFQNNILLKCSSYIYIVFTNFNNGVTLKDSVFYKCSVTSAVNQGTLTLINCKHDFSLQDSSLTFNACAKIATYTDIKIKCTNFIVSTIDISCHEIVNDRIYSRNYVVMVIIALE